ncbi:hypothetical protein L208DRAFT_1381382 [Tricholoma matsutake]|nr:hypothetical protein L208DRAFT_1381382 [Tricholoma matsutake 945]
MHCIPQEKRMKGWATSVVWTTNNLSSGNASEFVDKPDNAANVQCPIRDSSTSQLIEVLSLGDNEQTTFLQDYMGDKCSLGGTTNNSLSGNASEFVDKPDNAANIQHPIRDSGTSQSIEVPSLGDAPMNEQTTFLQEYSCNATPGESALYAFNPTSTLSSFGIQCNNQGFGNWSDVNWDTSQVTNGWQVQGNVPSDSWFSHIISSLLNYGLQNANLTLEAPQLAFTFVHAVPQGPPVPMLAQVPPLLAVQSPPMVNPSSFLPLSNTDAPECHSQDMYSPSLAKEAKAMQDAAIEAAKAAKVATRAAKEAREAAKPEQAMRSGHASTLPDHLKQVGYAPPKWGSQAKKSA